MQNTAYHKNNNNSLRCIHDPSLNNKYQIIFYGNGGKTPNNQTQTVQEAKMNEYTTLTPNPFTRSGYSFKGWATSSNGSVKYTNGQSVINIGTKTTPAELYAVWEFEPEKCPGTDIIVMQNWNGANSLSMMESTSLCDIRDNQIYTVAKLDDGNVWMTQNLRLDLAAVTINANNTNNPTLEFMTAVNNRQFGQWKCYDAPQVYSCAIQHDKPIFSTSSNSNYGAYYNFYTATAGTQPYTYYGGSQGDICPAGWHLPTKDEWNSFISKVVIMSNSKVAHNATVKKLLAAPYNYVLAGWYWDYPGAQDLFRVGQEGMYWIGQKCGETYDGCSYGLVSAASPAYIATRDFDSAGHHVFGGLTMRCIRDSSL